MDKPELGEIVTHMCDTEEQAAIVVRRNPDGTVNLLVFDGDGRSRPEYNVRIEEPPPGTEKGDDATDEEDRE